MSGCSWYRLLLTSSVTEYLASSDLCSSDAAALSPWQPAVTSAGATTAAAAAAAAQLCIDGVLTTTCLPGAATAVRGVSGVATAQLLCATRAWYAAIWIARARWPSSAATNKRNSVTYRRTDNHKTSCLRVFFSTALVMSLSCYGALEIVGLLLLLLLLLLLRDWQGRTSPKWPTLCRVGRKTLLRAACGPTSGWAEAQQWRIQRDEGYASQQHP